MPKNPYTHPGFDSIDRFEFIIISLVLILGWLTLLQDKTTTGLPAVGVDMHIHPWPEWISDFKLVLSKLHSIQITWVSIYKREITDRSISWFRIVVFWQKQVTPASSWEQDGVHRIDISLTTGSRVACQRIKLTRLLRFKNFISTFIAMWWLVPLPHLADMTLKKRPRGVVRTAHVIALFYNIHRIHATTNKQWSAH